MFPMNPSRYTFAGQHNGQAVQVRYGCDHALGYWIEVWPADDTAEEPEIDECTAFGLGRGRLVELLEGAGCPTTDHLAQIALGLPF
jgi:hypothetical protein